MPRADATASPGSRDARLATSSYLVRWLSVPRIWALARRTTPQGRKVYGRVDFRVREIMAETLQLDANFAPCRHVDIIGWSQEKDRNMAIAQALAERARPRRLREPIVATGELAD